MTQSNHHPQVNGYIKNLHQWHVETKKLRDLLLKANLTEDFKWKQPCYTYEGKNVVLIQGFKNYVALLFFKGAILPDPHRILTKMGPNTEIGRQIRFTKIEDFYAVEKFLPHYIDEAITIEKKGLKIKRKDREPLPIPEEFQDHLDKNSVLKEAFEALTPGRKKQYIHHFANAKQSKTKVARIKKALPKILAGKGLQE